MNHFTSIVLLTVMFGLSACSSSPRDQFVQGCHADGGPSKSVCKCAYDKLEKHYSADAMQKMSTGQMQFPEDFLNVMQRAAVQCQA